MKRLGNIKNVRLPLFLRVVALYVLTGVPIWVFIATRPPEPVVAAAPPKPAIVIREGSLRVGQPARVVVPRLGIDLKIIDGEYDKKKDTWTLSDDKAQFATMTSLPNNESGNTFIYGHNTDAVFAPLARLKTNDVVRVHTTNGLTFQYRYSGKEIVDPKTTSVLAASEAPRLTLMTCEGIFSQTRRVMFFDFERIV
jgi:LPXTG-site transpeptidase (sortase) family protein